MFFTTTTTLFTHNFDEQFKPMLRGTDYAVGIAILIHSLFGSAHFQTKPSS
jgi:hypothetical protein